MAKKIPGLRPEWQNFFSCLILHLTLPLVPLLLEYEFSGHVEAKSATLTAAMYSIAIGLSSRNGAIFGFGVIQALAFSAAFGFLSTTKDLPQAPLVSYVAIAVIMLFHTAERYNRHVIDLVPFFEFLPRNDDVKG